MSHVAESVCLWRPNSTSIQELVKDVFTCTGTTVGSNQINPSVNWMSSGKSETTASISEAIKKRSLSLRTVVIKMH